MDILEFLLTDFPDQTLRICYYMNTTATERETETKFRKKNL